MSRACCRILGFWRGDAKLRSRLASLAIVALCVAVDSARAETPYPFVSVVAPFASEPITLAASTGTVAYELVSVRDATWLRVRFGDSAIPQGAAIRVTSLADGCEQWLDQTALTVWHGTSAYFNGNAVLVELVASARARGTAQLVIDGADAGQSVGGVATICGSDDDRTAARDPRVARVVPIGCTAYLIDDATGCMLSAGHCVMSDFDVAEFNVPPSDEFGAIVHPPPGDQYVVDTTSMQSSNTGAGSDWAYFGLLPNTTTGTAARIAQAAWFELQATAPLAGSAVRVSGFGADDAPLTANGALQTASGPVIVSSLLTIDHAVDTTGGNSGSPLIDEATGRACGIHVNGGCSTGAGTNSATSLAAPGLEAALSAPRGVCASAPALAFSYPAGKPQFVSPQGGGTLAVQIAPQSGESVMAGAAYLWVRTSGNAFFAPITLAPSGSDIYAAALPSAPCGSLVEWFVTAANASGAVFADPVIAPALPFTAIAAIAQDLSFGDPFEQDLGWTVTSASTVTSGVWERAIPSGGGLRHDPPTDADGSGHCFVTQNGAGDTDLDGGWTRLTSPMLAPVPGSDPHVQYQRWFSTSAAADDAMIVALSNDDGATWTQIESVVAGSIQANGGWFTVTKRVADFVAVTNQLRVRFTATDVGQPSVTEAGVDSFAILNSASGVLCSHGPDLDDDGSVGPHDLAMLLAVWGACGGCPADFDVSGQVGANDLAVLLAAWSD